MFARDLGLPPEGRVKRGKSKDAARVRVRLRLNRFLLALLQSRARSSQGLLGRILSLTWRPIGAFVICAIDGGCLAKGDRQLFPDRIWNLFADVEAEPRVVAVIIDVSIRNITEQIDS